MQRNAKEIRRSLRRAAKFAEAQGTHRLQYVGNRVVLVTATGEFSRSDLTHLHSLDSEEDGDLVSYSVKA